MKLSILSREIKILSRCITSLSKLGDDVYIEWSDDELNIRTVNNSRSAYGRFQFSKEFFEKVQCVDKYSNIPRKLSLKSFLTVFQKSNLVEKCKLTFDTEGCEIIVQLFCQNEFNKIYNLKLMNSESLQPRYSLNDTPNILSINTKSLMEILNTFQSNHEELMILIDDKKCIFTTFAEGLDPSKTIQTKIPLLLDDFDEYEIVNTAELVICQKELRAALSYGDVSFCRVYFSYNVPGKPIILSYAEQHLKAHFILATLPRFTQSSCVKLPKKKKKLHTTNVQFEEDDEMDRVLSSFNVVDFEEPSTTSNVTTIVKPSSTAQNDSVSIGDRTLRASNFNQSYCITQPNNADMSTSFLNESKSTSNSGRNPRKKNYSRFQESLCESPPNTSKKLGNLFDNYEQEETENKYPKKRRRFDRDPDETVLVADSDDEN